MGVSVITSAQELAKTYTEEIWNRPPAHGVSRSWLSFLIAVQGV